MSRKRKRSSEELPEEVTIENPIRVPFVTQEFTDSLLESVSTSDYSKITRSAVAAVGSTIASTDPDLAKRFNHIFLNTLKPIDSKATDQGASGRCWIYAGLNMFRHLVGKALNIKDFEFSQNYLYFWDKYERSNTFLMSIIETRGLPLGDRTVDFLLEQALLDGGYWSMFSALVEKYGLVPKATMPETWQSCDSDDLNQSLRGILLPAVTIFREPVPTDELLPIRDAIMTQIFTTLTKYLGIPPREFSWTFSTEEHQTRAIYNLTPLAFKSMVLPGIDLDDYVALVNVPVKNRPFDTMYTLKYSNNVMEAEPSTMLNVNNWEMRKALSKSVMSGHPVWIGCDVMNDFQYYLSALDPNLMQSAALFGETIPTDKGHSLEYGLTCESHAMVLTGLNFNEKDHITDLQVENSWGYWDNEVRGLDGYLHMSGDWFDKNVVEIIVHKNYLTRSMQQNLLKDPVVLEPWDMLAKCTYIKGKEPPRQLRNCWKNRSRTTRPKR